MIIDASLPRLKTLVASTAVLAAAFGLSGCVGQDVGTTLSLEQSIATPKYVALASSSDREPSPRAAAALPLAAGAVVGIRDRGYADGFRQDVLLGGGAMRGVANGITILAHDVVPRGPDPLPFAKPTEASIASEIATQFPGVSMQVVTRTFANAYGPYGLALGRGSDDVRCLYAWQWIDDQTLLARNALAGPVSVRVRLCRSGQTFDAMATLMNGLVLGRDAAVAPREVAALSAVVEAPDAPGVRAAPARLIPGAKVARHATVHRHRLARHRVVAPRVAVEQPAAPQVVPGVRYLAPLTAEASPAPGTAIVASQTDAPKLSADLPPQAYLGPGATGRAVAPTPAVGR